MDIVQGMFIQRVINTTDSIHYFLGSVHYIKTIIYCVQVVSIWMSVTI